MTPDNSKRCAKCGIRKTEADFHRSKKRPDGRDPYCKACSAAKYRARKKANPDRVADQGRRSARRWRERYPHRYQASQERFRASKRKPAFVIPIEKQCAAYKVIFALDTFAIDKRRRDGRGSYCKPCDRIKANERTKRHQRKNLELTRQRQRSYKKKEKARETEKKYRRRPEVARAVALREKVRYHRRRLDGESVLTRKAWLIILEAFGGACCYCGACDEDLTVEHIDPLSRGGTNDIRNIAPACFKCNGEKRAKTIEVFAPHVAERVRAISLRCEEVYFGG